jgi:putative NADH-flavin reductase
VPDVNGVPVMDTAGFPPEFQPFSPPHRTALDIIRGSGLEWVAVSPSGNFDLEGEPTGAYHLAPGDLAAHITYADHARVLIDEAERAQFRQAQIGAAGAAPEPGACGRRTRDGGPATGGPSSAR